MTKSGIKIISDEPGAGPWLAKGDRVRIRFDCRLNHGEYVVRDADQFVVIGDRNSIAGFRYGLEGMRVGGRRTFQASPHLCYRDTELAAIPQNAVLIFDIKEIEVAPRTDRESGVEGE